MERAEQLQIPIQHSIIEELKDQNKFGIEILRLWLIGESIHVLLRTSGDDPGQWGLILADVAKHVAGIYSQLGLSGDDVMRSILDRMSEELKDKKLVIQRAVDDEVV